MADLKTIDDYTKLPKGYEDYNIEEIFEKVCNDTLESLAKEMIKRRIKNPPKFYVFSGTTLSRESLFQEFIKTNPILPNQSSYCVVAYFDPHYRILKRRTGYDKQRKYRKIKKRY